MAQRRLSGVDDASVESWSLTRGLAVGESAQCSRSSMGKSDREHEQAWCGGYTWFRVTGDEFVDRQAEKDPGSLSSM